MTYDRDFQSSSSYASTNTQSRAQPTVPTAPPRHQQLFQTFWDSDDDDFRSAVRQSMVENYARPSQTVHRVSLTTPLVRQNPPLVRPNPPVC